MRVAVCILTMDRPEMTEQVLNTNLYNSGYEDFMAFGWDNGSKDDKNFRLLNRDCEKVWIMDQNVGIGRAVNTMFNHAYNEGFDLFCYMGNDLLEQDDWLLKRVEAHMNINNSGMVSAVVKDHSHVWPWVWRDGYRISLGAVCGNTVISREVLDVVGYLHEGYIHGGIDLDYCFRSQSFGFHNYYVWGLETEHIGEEDPPGYGEWRKPRDEYLERHRKTVMKYVQGGMDMYKPFEP